MKNFFGNISEEEKNRILEMHSFKKNLISEQPEHFPGENNFNKSQKNKINLGKQSCQKQNNLSPNDFAIANFLIDEFDLYYAPIEGYGDVNDEKIINQLLKISSKQSYDKINKFLYCFTMLSPENEARKTFKENEDIIKSLLNDFLTGLSGITDNNLRNKINNHLQKIGVELSINMF